MLVFNCRYPFLNDNQRELDLILKGQEMEKCFKRGSEPNKDFWLVLNRSRTFESFIKSEKTISNPLQL